MTATTSRVIAFGRMPQHKRGIDVQNAVRIQLPNIGWQPRDYQRPFWDAWVKDDCKRVIGIWHRRAGKDDVCLHGAAIKLHERVGSYWHMLPEYAQARKAIWDAVNVHTGMRRIDEAFPPELIASKNDQEMKIKFKNGSTWQVIGSDGYNRLVGAGVAGVTFSEWALANPSAWAYIRPMLVENGGWAAFITTPRGQNHAYDMIEGNRDNPKWFTEVLDVYKTGAVGKEDLLEALAEYKMIYGDDFGTAVFEQEYECSFTAAIMGAFYADRAAAPAQRGADNRGMRCNPRQARASRLGHWRKRRHVYLVVPGAGRPAGHSRLLQRQRLRRRPLQRDLRGTGRKVQLDKGQRLGASRLQTAPMGARRRCDNHGSDDEAGNASRACA
jgi:hypothetical protein